LRVYGGIVERDVGWALVEYGGKRRVVPVIFGERGGAPVLGATSLEALGYQVDPVKKRLRLVELLMVQGRKISFPDAITSEFLQIT
jgi:predicted aspartyl protease